MLYKVGLHYEQRNTLLMIKQIVRYYGEYLSERDGKYDGDIEATMAIHT